MIETPKGVRIAGIGSATPSKVISNRDLEKILDTSDEWIKSRTGISERRVVEPSEDSLEISVKACQKALGNTDPNEIDLIVVATSTPDFLYPSTACRVQAALKANRAAAFDLSAACTGFIFSLVTAAQFLQLGTYRKALVLGVDIHSRFLDWTDRSTSILFGDGAGAVLIEQTSFEENQLLSHSIHSDGSGGCDLSLKNVSGGYPSGKLNKQTENVQMNGRKIYQFAVTTIPKAIEETATMAGHKPEDINYLICHQANQRILDSVAEKMNWPKEKCISNISKYGNTSAASIPLAWDESYKSFQNGDLISLAGFGAGLTWGSLIWKWKEFN
ncbi:MAG: beta-ketoacyl-ACP synthase III [Candidatus Caenarcaniphilales bacterium]|nr:beta-ketoacyl-ACP synthase III [Candidatus Caenarcaniphilales bacterium]